ncbi:cysteine desulfurase family protein [Sphaerisporangium sp. NPDC051011]|uniref:cysteine desulfurase family protein n=1 Tax=Sphaerisporangium sp. NPDC051011 TaxID=3155792 RepID=UPI0033DEDB8E
METREAEASTSVVYLDYNATAPLRPEALAAMLPILQGVGNSSSPHALGQRAARAVDIARRQLADLIGCSPGEIIFTSGATEANNLALGATAGRGGQMVTGATEHPAVLEAARAVSASSGAGLTILPVDSAGRIDLPTLSSALRRGPVSVVSVMAANNETGVLSDLSEVIELAHQAGALVHTDATQMVGRLSIDLSDLGVDLLSLSAHKFGGPQGVGALFIRRGISLPYTPLLIGGGQEKGWRAGTLNVAGVVGMGAAAASAATELTAEVARTAALRNRLEASLLAKIPGSRVNGDRKHRLPGVTSITFPGAPADALISSMPDVAVSDGSACSSGAPGPSHVLLAMGLSYADAESTLRFSLGYATTNEHIDYAIAATVGAVQRVQTALHVPSAPA